MAEGLGATFKTFWHTMTSYDRHASHDSPYRTTGSGQGIGRNPPLHSITTGGFDSTRENLNHPYHDDPVSLASRSTTALAAAQSAGIYSPAPNSGSMHASPTTPYAPGRRSLTLATGGANGGVKDVPLQDFADGLPPPPPVGHSWSRIDRWAETNYPELYDQLCEGATVNDINEVEFDLDCTLPLDVRESMTIHDGQERGGMPTGIIFSCMLLDCEEMLDEWKNWRTVNQEFLSVPNGLTSSNSEAGPSRSKTIITSRQDSCPEGAVQKVYAHPGWIPMARDWGGNNIAIDLAPGPTGKWGQVILSGRDYDCKYVVARSWAAFLAMVADDLESDHWYVDEDSNELRLKDPRAPRREPSYFDILRVRTMQKYKRVPRRAPAPGSQHGSAPGSPSSYTSNGNGSDPIRGRGPNRDSHSSPGSSLKPTSRLSRVTEEAPALPLPAHTKSEGITGKENGSTQDLSKILEEPKPQDKTTAAVLKGLEEVSLDSKAAATSKSDLLADGPDSVSRPPVAVNRRSTEDN